MLALLGVEHQCPLGVLVRVPIVRHWALRVPDPLCRELNLLSSPRGIECVHGFLIATRAEPNRCGVAALDDEVPQGLRFVLLSLLYTLYDGCWCPHS